MDEQPSAGAPPVVAVVVTRDPGPWFEDALAALGDQDYPNLSVLVVDAGGDPGLTARVASVLPGAFVRRAPGMLGFGAGANEVLDVVEGASHFLFCHDDVAPSRDSVRVLVEEAFRSNAGIVTPKIVEWDAPDRLLAVGLSVDKLAAVSPLVEAGELDQEQHDAVRDVFAGPSACMLVRADLFATLHGFDAAMSGSGDAVDLCWRAQLAGARVVTAPAARVRHRCARERGERPMPVRMAADDRSVVAARSRLRTVLKNYGVLHLLRILPQAVLIALFELVWAAITADGRRARAVAGAWTWNLGRLAELRKTRRQAQALRAMSDGELRRLQAHGSARVAAFLRTAVSGDGDGRSVASVGRDLAGSVRSGSLRLPLTIWTVITVVLLVGSRHLGRIPAVGQLAPFPNSPLELWRSFMTGWRTPGLGSSGPAPLAFALLAMAGTLLLGGMGFLRQLLILGAFPVAAAGAYRLARPLGSRRVRLASVIVYLAIPVPYNALARGRWPGLIVFAVAPFLLRRLAVAAGLPPFAPASAAPARKDRRAMVRRLAAHALPLALLTALVAAFVPSILLVLPVLAVALVIGSVAAGEVLASTRALVVAVAASIVATALLFPWSLELFGPGAGWPALTGVRGSLGRTLDAGSILRFHTGPVGAAPLGWVFLVAAVLPLLIGRDWRLAWAVRLWAVAMVCWGLLWAMGRGWLGVPPPAPEVLLAPAAMAMAACVALGVAAFEVDLPGYAFGWRQVASAVAAVAVALGLVPVVQAAANGRWHVPQDDFAQLLAWMPAQREAGDFRVLWVGDAAQLPLAGWPLGGGLAYATSRGGFPDARDLWPGSSDGATRLLADAVGVAHRGETTHLGRLLAPTGVRYLALPTQRAPAQAGPGDPIPADLMQGLRSQLDLKEVESDPGLVVYENVAWAPVRSSFDPGAAAALDSRSLASAAAVDLTSGHPVLTRHRGPASFSGSVDRGDSVFLAEGRSSRWQLRSGGRTAHRQSAFGWANAFTDVGGGKSSLRYNTPISRWIALLLEVAIWVAVVRGIMVLRPFRRADEGDGDGSEEVTGTGTSAGAGSAPSASGSGSGDGSGDGAGDAAVTGLATSAKGTE